MCYFWAGEGAKPVAGAAGSLLFLCEAGVASRPVHDAAGVCVALAVCFVSFLLQTGDDGVLL